MGVSPLEILRCMEEQGYFGRLKMLDENPIDFLKVLALTEALWIHIEAIAIIENDFRLNETSEGSEK